MSINTHDPRYLRTEKALHSAMRDLIKTKPFRSITVNDIVERAAVARKTFYSHYEDKTDLLWQVLAADFKRIVTDMGTVDPESLLVDGKPLSYPIFAHVQDFALFYGDVLNENGSPDMILKMWTYIARVSYEKHEPLRQAAPYMTVAPELIAEMLAGAALGTVRWWLQTGMKQSPETMAYTFSQVMAPGVLASMGIDDF